MFLLTYCFRLRKKSTSIIGTYFISSGVAGMGDNVDYVSIQTPQPTPTSTTEGNLLDVSARA